MNARHAQPARDISRPEPGRFKMKLVKGGPFVAAEILVLPNGDWAAEINGKMQTPSNSDPAHAAGVFRIWTGGQRITDGEFNFLRALAEWARKNDPNHPLSAPHKAVKLGTSPSVF